MGRLRALLAGQGSRDGHAARGSWAELAGLGIGPLKVLQNGWNGLPKWVRFGPQIGPWVIIGSGAWGPNKNSKIKDNTKRIKIKLKSI